MDASTPADEEGGTESLDSTNEVKEKKPLLISRRIGTPKYVLNPEYLGDPSLGKRIVRYYDDTIVKFGGSVRLAEAEAMHMIAEQTSIPVPRVIGAYLLEGICYIIMSFEKGQPLDVYWNSATEAQQEHVIEQLRDYVSQMRKIKGTFIGGIDYAPCEDGLFMWDFEGMDRAYGPYQDEAAFNEGIIEALHRKLPPETFKEPPDPTSAGYNKAWEDEQLVRSLKGHEIVFTHGDLNHSNILVRDDGTVVLIDWGCSGYWPSYWEYHRTTLMGTFRHDFIRQIVRFIPPFYQEALVIRHIWRKLLG